MKGNIVAISFCCCLKLNSLLVLLNSDACFGMYDLDGYLLFIIVGFYSNFNILPLAFVGVSAGEFTETWTEVWKDFRAA